MLSLLLLNRPLCRRLGFCIHLVCVACMHVPIPQESYTADSSHGHWLILPFDRRPGMQEGAVGGELVAESTGGQISSRLLSMRSANALLELPQVPTGLCGMPTMHRMVTLAYH